MRIDPTPFSAGMERQLRRLEAALADGMPRRGWKIGINVPEVLDGLSLPHPGLGWIDGRAVLRSGSTFVLEPGHDLRVEPEVALLVAGRVEPGTSPDAARSHVAAVHPALEIVDYARPGSGLPDLIGHSMFHAACVIADPVPLEAAQQLGHAWPRMRIGGGEAQPASRCDLVPSDFGELVSFASDFLAAFGQTLDDGDLLLSGAYLERAAPIAAGESAVADFGEMGSVSIFVSEARARDDGSHPAPDDRARQRRTIEVYDSAANEYLEATRDFSRGIEWVERFVAELPAGALVADLGSGPGRDTARLRLHGLNAFCLDLSLGMLRAGREEFPAPRVQGSVLSLPLADDSLQGAWANASLLHLSPPELDRALREIRRVLVPAGHLHLTLKRGEGAEWDASRYGRPRWFQYWSGAELDRALRAAGLVPVFRSEEPSRSATWLVQLCRAT